MLHWSKRTVQSFHDIDSPAFNFSHCRENNFYLDPRRNWKIVSIKGTELCLEIELYLWKFNAEREMASIFCVSIVTRAGAVFLPWVGALKWTPLQASAIGPVRAQVSLHRTAPLRHIGIFHSVHSRLSSTLRARVCGAMLTQRWSSKWGCCKEQRNDHIAAFAPFLYLQLRPLFISTRLHLQCQSFW